MVLGVGIDLVEIKRLSKSFKLHKERFIERIAHPIEIDEAKESWPEKKQLEFWASRFAVKEAFSKAFGTGIGKSLSLSSIGVRHLSSGKPVLVFDRKINARIKKMGIIHTHVSISHTSTHACAVVVLEA